MNWTYDDVPALLRRRAATLSVSEARQLVDLAMTALNNAQVSLHGKPCAGSYGEGSLTRTILHSWAEAYEARKMLDAELSK